MSRGQRARIEGAHLVALGIRINHTLQILAVLIFEHEDLSKDR